jgi:hypothetical protein
MSLRLLQHRAEDGERKVIAATAEGAAFITDVGTTRELATCAIDAGTDLAGIVAIRGTHGRINIAAELAAGRILAPIDHDDPAHLLMTGTGLTHLGSAEARDKMHQAAATAATTDSMRMFLDGLAGGKPATGEIGQQPEWFYKGDGSSLAGPEQPLTSPGFAQDAGEEPELAGVYLIGPDGTPFRLGLCLANEFSDHVTERHNYLWLAHSKLRQAALGPELLTGPPPMHVEGVSRIRRGNEVIWEKPFLSGELNMSHSLANLEAHHFKYTQFRRPGDIHVHFFGTGTLSFNDGIRSVPGDVFEIEAAPFSLPLRNRLQTAPAAAVTVRIL